MAAAGIQVRLFGNAVDCILFQEVMYEERSVERDNNVSRGREAEDVGKTVCSREPEK